ncbi:MAG: hybrid sensor histidine kinase/response regulator [bacterium]|nr:hybrid sensor histidine kinase/response regulator [bacterium]
MEEMTVFKILIVDDVAKNIQVAANILRDEGYRMAFAQDGKAAMEKINSNDFDLVLLDVMMPGMDGFTVCRELKKNSKTCDIPVIFLTAKTETEDIVHGFEEGAVDYVTKPFNGAELLARVKTHLQLKAARERLNSANNELKALNATKDKFFSIIGHDLKNPIQGLILSAHILQNNFDDLEAEKVKEYIDKFGKSARHIADLLKNLLDWSRSQRGKIQCRPGQVDLHLLIKESIELLDEQAQGKGIRLVCGTSQDTCAFVDYDMLTTVIRNLISNSIKFTPPGGEVYVSAQVDEKRVDLTVSDNGVGIEPRDIENLFRIDTQTSTKGTSGEKGTGLGLILCKEFIEKNNGTIRVESQHGQGSDFIITLPSCAEG